MSAKFTYYRVENVSACEVIAAMREWLMDIEWADVDEYEIQGMPDAVIVRAVENHYEGGRAAFMRAL